MNVRVRTILHLVDVLGGRELEVELPSGSTVGDLFGLLALRTTPTGGHSLFEAGTANPVRHVRVLVNGRQLAFLSGTDTILSEGDDVLFLPPAAGG